MIFVNGTVGKERKEYHTVRPVTVLPTVSVRPPRIPPRPSRLACLHWSWSTGARKGYELSRGDLANQVMEIPGDDEEKIEEW